MVVISRAVKKKKKSEKDKEQSSTEVTFQKLLSESGLSGPVSTQKTTWKKAIKIYCKNAVFLMQISSLYCPQKIKSY